MKDWYNKHKNVIFIVVSVLIFLNVLSVVMTVSNPTSGIKLDEVEEITYTEFLELANSGKIDTIYYSTSNEYMRLSLLNDETKKMTVKEREEYTGYKVEDFRKCLYPAYKNFRKDMLKKDIRMVVDSSKTTTVNLLSNLITLGIPIFWIILLIRFFKKGGMGAAFGEYKADDLIQTSDTKFSDVIGLDEIMEDVKLVVELIKNPKAGKEIGAKTPKGILLTGEPGVGKTLIAKAIAGEAGVPFVSMGGSDFKEMFVGLGAKRVRDLFKVAKEHAPCIIFIDEIDGIGAKRDRRYGGSTEDDQTINALLKEMDGFSDTEGIFVLAATNHPDKLDKALVRAGRFDRQIAVNAPRDWKVREELLKFYLKDYKLADDVDIENFAKTVSGFTGADISMVCNEAGIVALMHKKKVIDNACLDEALDRKIFKGSRSKKEQFKKDREIIAYHEAGHAVMTYLVGEPISRASIQSTTSGVGGAVFRQDTNSFFTTDKELREQIMIAYAGRASEEIKYGVVTQGATNDITQATQVMIAYIQKYGFDKDFGMLDMEVLYNQSMMENKDITDRLSDMSKEMYIKTKEYLNKNYNLVEVLATNLLEKETLTGDEIEKLLDDKMQNDDEERNKAL